MWYGEGMLDELRNMYAMSPRPIYVMGHSLGAALATIAAARIVVEHDLPLAGLYTVGSPRYVFLASSVGACARSSQDLAIVDCSPL